MFEGAVYLRRDVMAKATNAQNLDLFYDYAPQSHVLALIPDRTHIIGAIAFSRVINRACKSKVVSAARIAIHCNLEVSTVLGWRVGIQLPTPAARTGIIAWITSEECRHALRRK